MAKLLSLFASVLILGYAAGQWVNDGSCGFSQYDDAGTPFSGGRIVGGEEARPGEFPWQLNLQINFGVWIEWCGAVIITDEWALTAAHCVQGFGPNGVRVIAGDHDTQSVGPNEAIHSLTEIIVHENYPQQSDHDIALVHVASAFDTSNDDVGTVCPPDAGAPNDGEISQCSGWGALSWGGSAPSILNWVWLETVPHDDCNDAFQGTGLSVSETEICAGVTDVRDSCSGDSGGPLTIKRGDVFQLIGLVSWGIECAAGYPGVYCRTSEFVDWVNSHI